MTALQVFRTLILIRFLIPLISGAVAAIRFHGLPFPIHEAQSKFVLTVIFALIVGDVAVTVGLWCLRRWARWGLLIWIFADATFALSLMRSHSITPASWTEMYVVHVVAGAIIAMMFLPPISSRFAKLEA